VTSTSRVANAAVAGGERDTAARQDHLDLAPGQLMGQPQLVIATAGRGDDRLPGGELLVQAGEGQHVALLEAVVVAGAGELERQDPEVGQVLAVDPGASRRRPDATR
jgi:hypothetical protein